MNTSIELGGRSLRWRMAGKRVLEVVGLAAVLGLFVSGCVGEGEAAPGDGTQGATAGETASEEAAAIGTTTEYGDEIPLGAGTARTYVVMDGDVPVEFGIALSETALEDLPADGAEGGVVMPDGHSTFLVVLPTPESNPTPIQHVMLDWNPAGHEPDGVYNRPHFDFHFYTVSEHDRHAIDPTNPEFLSQGSRLPSPDQIPAGYILAPVPPVPFMGAHLIHADAPEVRPTNPEPFTHTFIYGSWDGRLIFLEPMITTAFLLERGTTRVPVSVAGDYEPAGYYPASYEIEWVDDAREYRVALTDLAWRE